MRIDLLGLAFSETGRQWVPRQWAWSLVVFLPGIEWLCIVMPASIALVYRWGAFAPRSLSRELFALEPRFYSVP